MPWKVLENGFGPGNFSERSWKVLEFSRLWCGKRTQWCRCRFRNLWKLAHILSVCTKKSLAPGALLRTTYQLLFVFIFKHCWRTTESWNNASKSLERYIAEGKSFPSVYCANVSVRPSLHSSLLQCFSMDGIPQKCRFGSRGGFWNPSKTWFIWPTRDYIANVISIGSAVFAQLKVECSYTHKGQPATFPAKLPLPIRGSAPSSWAQPTRPWNAVSVGSVVFAGLTKVTSTRHTHKHTDRRTTLLSV